MISKSRSLNVVFAILALLVLATCSAYFSIDTSHIRIDGVPMHGVTGIFYTFVGMTIAAFAVIFALGVTGVVLAGVSVVIVGVFAIAAAACILAMIPAMLPLFIVGGLLYLVFRKNKSRFK